MIVLSDNKSKKHFTKKYVREATNEEKEYILNAVQKKKMFEMIFYIICTISALVGTIVFTIDVFSKTILEYNYISLIFAIFFLFFTLCFVYDTTYKVIENKMLKNNEFQIVDGMISKVLSKNNKNMLVYFEADDGWSDDYKYQIDGVSHKKGDKVLLVTFFNKKGILCGRLILQKTK